MPNYNPDTGLPYGVISCHSLADWCLEDLFYGPGARNLSEEQAYADAKAEIERELRWEIDDGKHSAADEPDFDFEDEVEHRLEQAMQNGCEIEEPVIEGECDGVKYRISWLGGAPLLWSFSGPEGNARCLCSPCVPGAADLDSGFVLDSELEGGPEWAEIGVSEFDHDNGFPCHCVPRGWLDKEGE
jgi:hypothetical protein